MWFWLLVLMGVRVREEAVRCVIASGDGAL